MIGKIKGKLTEISGNVGLIETQSGISYEIFLTNRIIGKHPSNQILEIYTYLQVREDAMVLFGFSSRKEYELFKLLISVSGVGPKTAFSVVSFISASDIVEAIRLNNADELTRVPGLGKKTAMKIILELSSKMKMDFDMKNIVLSEDDKVVLDALTTLGYKSADAKKMLIDLPKNLSVEEKIKAAMRKNKRV